MADTEIRRREGNQHRLNAEGFIEALRRAKTLTVRCGQFADAVSWTFAVDDLAQGTIGRIIQTVRADVAREEAKE